MIEHGHVNAADYPPSAVNAYLEAIDRRERAQRKARVLDLRAAQATEAKDFDAYFKLLGDG